MINFCKNKLWINNKIKKKLINTVIIKIKNLLTIGYNIINTIEVMIMLVGEC